MSCPFVLLLAFCLLISLFVYGHVGVFFFRFAKRTLHAGQGIQEFGRCWHLLSTGSLSGNSGGSEKSRFGPYPAVRLFRCRVFSDGLGTLADSVLGQLSWKEEADCGLDFAAGDGRFLVVVCEAGRLGGDSFKNVVHKAVHDAHVAA